MSSDSRSVNQKGRKFSYSATPIGFASRLAEAVNLYRAHTNDVSGQVRRLIERLKTIEARVCQNTGVALRGLDLLEIGPGQTLRYLKYFALNNQAIGIDLDIVDSRRGIKALWRMYKVNGIVRTVKTTIRKALGVDSKLDAIMASQLGVAHMPTPRVIQMNAEALEFAPESFDCIFSCSTFEHLSRPELVLTGIKRVLKPGGVVYITLHLYTSEGGAHDPRIISGQRGALPYWAHLRAHHRSKVRSNSFLNQIRLNEWERMFRNEFPGVTLEYERGGRPEITSELARLRSAGELKDFTDEELLTVEVVAVWKKPCA